jgi:YD repeat-containing protein
MGRIKSVKDPMNEYLRYDYDRDGDLIAVTDDLPFHPSYPVSA